MAVTNFTPLLGLALPTTGDLSGTWGTTVNTAITDLLDDAVAGTVTLSADADVTLSTTNGADNQARNAVILWTASNGATTRNITAPAQSKAYVVINAGTGSVVIRGSGPTTGVTVISGEKCLVAWNGSDFVKISTTEVDGVSTISFGSTGLTPSTATSGAVTVAGTLAVANGGTGATTAPNALTNLAAAGTGISNTFTANQIISVTDNTNAALRITQLGTGNALLVEDTTNPDASPFVIDASGNVGIGTTTPSIKLNVQADTSLSIINAISSGATQYRFLRTNGTLASPTTVNSGENLAVVRFEGYDGTNYIQAASITAAVDGTPGTNDMPGRLVFSTTADGASSTTERMRINSSGQVGIGATPQAGRTFSVEKAITGATGSFAQINAGAIQSDVTTAGYYYSSFASTASAIFTIGQISHYATSGGTTFANVTAGGAVTSQYGFQVASGLTGATNNYGFYGDIASGTGRYNLYMNGTAENYLGGATTINTNSTTDALRITQTGSGNALLVEDSTNPDATPFVINSGGQVSVGYTSQPFFISGVAPNFGIIGTGNTDGGFVSARYSNDAGGAWMFLGKSRGAIGSQGVVSSGDTIGIFDFAASDGTIFTSAARITAAVDGTPGTNDMPGRLVFSTTADGASSPTERMRIDSAGRVGIGGTPPAGWSVLLGKNITGAASSYGFIQSSAILSDVSNAFIFNSNASTEAAAFTLTGLNHFRASQSTIGAGSSVTNQYGYFAESTLTGATNNYGFYGNIASGANRYNLYMNGTADNYMAGSLGIGAVPSAGQTLRLAKTITGSTSSFSVINNGVVQSDVTTDAQYFNAVASTAAAAFVAATVRGYYYRQATIGVGSSITNQYGFFVESDVTGATNNYGFYGNIASGANRYNLYMGGTADNYLAGNVGIGSASPAANTFVIGKTVTGATTGRFIWLTAPIASDVTTNAFGVATNISTQAAAFTLNELVHFFAAQSTIGAGSSVNTQYGFNVNSSLTGATNNYGFYGNIASGTNRYNLYMAGTAANYMAGSLGIGAVPSAGTALFISKAMTGSAVAYGINNTTTVALDVTTTARSFNSVVATQAAAFTLSQLVHYRTEQGTIGATSAVTDQYGFFVDSTLTGATNNYGFFGNIAAGTNRFNLYMQGSAANRFNGDLLVYGGTAIPAGGTTGSGYKLSSTANFGVFFGSGAPTLSAAKGSLYLRSDGTTTNNRMYVNTDGSTTWTAVTTAA